MAEYKVEYIKKWGYKIIVVYARRKPLFRRTITPWIVVHMENVDNPTFKNLD